MGRGLVGWARSISLVSRHFNSPSAIEATRPDLSDRIPVCVGIGFVGDLQIREAAQRVDEEPHAVATVVIRIHGAEDAELVVRLYGRRVPPHLVSDPISLWGRVPNSGGRVHVRAVERDPDFGKLRRGR